MGESRRAWGSRSREANCKSERTTTQGLRVGTWLYFGEMEGQGSQGKSLKHLGKLVPKWNVGLGKWWYFEMGDDAPKCTRHNKERFS
jgi:hypothetical protein